MVVVVSVASALMKAELAERRMEVLNALDDTVWLKPIDLGGYNGSHHHNDLRHWRHLDAVDWKPVGGYMRRTMSYRRTVIGNAILQEWKDGLS